MPDAQFFADALIQDKNAIYDGFGRLLSIEDVQIQNEHFQVRLQLQKKKLWNLKTFKPLSTKYSGYYGQYDFVSQRLTLPSVQAFGGYFNVTFTNIGDYVFRLDQVEEVKP